MPEVDDSHNAERRENLRWDAGAYRRPRRRCEACTQTPRFPAFGPPKFHPGRHCGELACRHSLRIRRLSCRWHDRHYRAVRQAGEGDSEDRCQPAAEGNAVTSARWRILVIDAATCVTGEVRGVLMRTSDRGIDRTDQSMIPPLGSARTCQHLIPNTISNHLAMPGRDRLPRPNSQAHAASRSALVPR